MEPSETEETEWAAAVREGKRARTKRAIPVIVGLVIGIAATGGTFFAIGKSNVLTNHYAAERRDVTEQAQRTGLMMRSQRPNEEGDNVKVAVLTLAIPAVAGLLGFLVGFLLVGGRLSPEYARGLRTPFRESSR